ncbi:hypothetical protein BCL76_11745 [Streptomyces sp. CG 926]|uniref:hypothetical protein n=1 Tax=Streptomyces sp. CG 926 TaxID=1882405 RepID=UPI000D6AA0F5|nr:hypothetical protein [Streptomyces sp. CG 926]PWK63968.1 hypothetical protein BCL76_11745 [Streptomyces sp. CG 926]
MSAAGENGERPLARRPRMQHEGGTADEHGRRPGAPTRTGTGAQPAADAERVGRANESRTRTARVLHRKKGERPDEEDDRPR